MPEISKHTTQTKLHFRDHVNIPVTQTGLLLTCSFWLAIKGGTQEVENTTIQINTV